MVITSCGCIFCIDCSGPATQAGCVSCGAKGIKTLSLGKDLPPHVMELFNSNVNSLAKVIKRKAFKNRQFEKTAKLMMDFENKEKSQLREKGASLREQDKELARLEKQVREAEAENERLEAMLEQENGDLPSPPKRVYPVTLRPLSIPSPKQPRAPSEDGGRQGQRAPVWKGNFTGHKLF